MKSKNEKKQRYAGPVLEYLKPWTSRYIIGLLTSSTGNYLNSLTIGLYVGNMLAFAQAGEPKGLLLEAGKWLLVMIFVLTVGAFGSYLVANASRKAAAELKRVCYTHMLKAPYSSADKRHSGDQLSRLDNDVQMCQQLYNDLIPTISSTVLSVLLGVATVWTIHWSIALSLVGVGLVMMLLNLVVIRKNGQRYALEAEQIGKTFSYMSDLLSGSELERIYGEDTGLTSRFRDSCKKLFRLSMKALNVRSVYNGLNQVNTALTIATSVGLGLVFYRQGVISMAALPLLIQMGTVVVEPITKIGWAVGDMQEIQAGARRVVEILDQKMEFLNPGKESSFPSLDIQAQHLAFSYNSVDFALMDVNFKLSAGGIYGIVGYSGSGKSTLLRLLMGIEPYQGCLSIGGNEVREIPLDSLRKQIAYVPQECPLFDGSVLDNIRLGKQNTTDEEVIAAAKKADADEFVQKLENGYHTQVGENGVKLSGGQRQRIAIARAILKDAPILLLDEVTAALDSTAELRIQQSLNRLMQGRTTLVVAHRLSNIVDTDHILVFDKGSLVQQGTHEELVHTEGIYKKLYTLQASLGK